ncbi:MAG TPA: hypothetical protein VFU23_04250 [Gemmatimonadales bacterium]|nr:hypothetical protein [Gemmatimonadales bacterium]
MRTSRIRLPLAFPLALGLSACGAGSGPSPVLSVGGTYQTVVTLLESTCAGQTVEQHATTVTHTPGATSLVVSHAGSDYPGTVSTGGMFSTPAVTQIFDGISYQITIAGAFSRTGMDARVDVSAARQPPCSFAARWAGLKSGEPNVIP